MSIAVENRQSDGLETDAVTSRQTRWASVTIKKLLLVPFAYAAVFALINGPDHDGLSKGGIYGALIGGTGLAAAMLCAKSWREFLSIPAGVTMGTALGAQLMVGQIRSESAVHCIIIGAVIGWLAMRPFRQRRR